MAELRPIQFGDPYKGIQDILKLYLANKKQNELTAYQKAMLERYGKADAQKGVSNFELKNIGGLGVLFNPNTGEYQQLNIQKKLSPKESLEKIHQDLDGIILNDFTLYNPNFINPENGNVNQEFIDKTIKEYQGFMGEDINKSVFNRAVKSYKAKFSTNFDKYLAGQVNKYYTNQKTGIETLSKLEKEKSEIQSKLDGITVSDEGTAQLQEKLFEIEDRIDAYEGLLQEQGRNSFAARDIYNLRKPFMTSTSEALARQNDILEADNKRLQDSYAKTSNQSTILSESYRKVIAENKELKDIISGAEKQQTKEEPIKKDGKKKYVSPAQKLFYENFLPYIKSKGEVYESRKKPIRPTFDIPLGFIGKYAQDPQNILPFTIDGTQVRLTPSTEWLGSFFTGENKMAIDTLKTMNEGFQTEQDFTNWLETVQQQIHENQATQLNSGTYTK